jgi:hypothetical protein
MTGALAGMSPAELEDMAHYLARVTPAKAP